MTKVSVLMPVYNAEAYLAEAIDSVLNQTFSDWELLIGDDGSTDGTENIVKAYSDPRIQFYKNAENKGHTYTKYTLLEKSTGEYIAFLDADDVSLPDRLRLQVDFLDNNKDYGLCGTWGAMIDPSGKRMKKIRFATQHEDLRCSLLFNTSFLQSSILVKRDLMKDLYYDKDILLVEDFNFECLVAKQAKVANIAKELVKYRWHDSNISNTKQEVLKNLNKKIYERELLNLKITASERELDIHNAVRDKSTLDIANKEFFDLLKAWLKKLVEANKQNAYYDRNTFVATVCLRWMFACKERGCIFKAFNLPVALNFASFSKLLNQIFIKLRS